MSSFIDVRYDIFTEKEIARLLFYFYENEESHSKYNETIVLPFDINNLDLLNKKYAPFVSNNIVDWAQIVKWPKGAYQDLHSDYGSENTTLSSITYLNHDFVGGETIFEEGTTVNPYKNKTIFFTGQDIKHKVNKVTQGVRYTIATWYKKK